MPKFAAIPYADFARIRLAHFLPGAEIQALRNWEYLGQFWVGEGYGFTNVMQLESKPNETAAILIALTYLPELVHQQVLAAVGLPLHRGMQSSEVTSVLGTTPTPHQYVNDRTTYEYQCGDPPYTVSCTCLHDGGLIFVEVCTPLPPSASEP